MTRRDWLGAVLAAPVRAARPPNIVFLLTDDQRWDSLGCMGNPVVRTPNIDRLAARGVRFENHFVTTAICVSSRASIFTGLYSRCHRIWNFGDSFPPDVFARSYPALLRRAGYRTGFIGKWGIDGGAMPSAAFDYFRGFQGQGRYFPDKSDPRRHLTAVMGDQAAEFLAGCTGDRPFCLSVSFKAPHVQDEHPDQFLYDPADEDLYRDVTIPVPETADPRFIAALPVSIQRSEGRRRWGVRFSTPALYQRSVKGYYRLISGVDRVVGRLMDLLARAGFDQNTVVIYSSDNGFYLSEHGLAGKWFMHEESIRTPLLIADPRLPPAGRGRRVRQMTLNIDIAPTLLALAGVEAERSMQGRNLRPLLQGEVRDWRREWFYEHHFRSNGWIPASEGIRTERWKYIAHIDEQPLFEELYDLAADPRERDNLARTPASSARMEALRARRQAWIRNLEAWRPGAPWHEPAGSGD
ncbi:MAG: sulfatase [Bryobacterales bacterium]|nr:sulfatase [Bryobacterales bacterium]